MTKSDQTTMESVDAQGEGYPLRVATRVTGLKAELLRAWESRYDAIRPQRTAGGARRYSAGDLDRLRLLRDVVAAGHRISRVARLDDSELAALLCESGEAGSLAPVIEAAERLDAREARRLIEADLEKRGSIEFATDFAAPLLVEVGRRWERGEVSVSAEHLVSGILRGILTDLVIQTVGERSAPDLVFATPPGESHDLGTLMASLVAAHAGARLAFLGADVPIADMAERVVRSGATVLVLGIVTLSPEAARACLRQLRASMPERIGIWIGGAGIDRLEPIAGVERIDNLEQLEAHVVRLGLGALPRSAAEGRGAPRRVENRS